MGRSGGKSIGGQEKKGRGREAAGSDSIPGKRSVEGTRKWESERKGKSTGRGSKWKFIGRQKRGVLGKSAEPKNGVSRKMRAREKWVGRKMERWGGSRSKAKRLGGRIW